MSRTPGQIPLRVWKNGGTPVVPTQLAGPASSSFSAGSLLTLKKNGRVAKLPNTIDATTADPVRYIALSDYDHTKGGPVAVQEITSDTVLLAQVNSGVASSSDIGRRGVLQTINGNYVLALSDTNPCVEVVDTEDNFAPFDPNSATANNLVAFRFLAVAIDKAPQP